MIDRNPDGTESLQSWAYSDQKREVSVYLGRGTIGDDTLVIRGTDLTLELAAGTLISEDRPIRSTEHPTMKPVSLVRRLLLNSTSRDDLVLDPFGGSGSTLIACQTMNRRAALVEIEPAYCDVIIERWQNATGKKAVRDGVR